MSHASLRRQSVSGHAAKVARFSRAAGGRADATEDKALVRKGIGQHDSQLHGGKHTKLKLKDGGAVAGKVAKPRLDRPGRAAGGRAKGKSGNHVNVIVAPGHGGQGITPPPPMGGLPPHPPSPPPGPPPGMPPPGGGPGMGMPPRPPMAGMGPPPGGPPPMMHARGGRVGRKEGGSVSLKYGSKSGEGRLEKLAAYGRDAEKGEKGSAIGKKDVDLEDKPFTGPERKKGGRAC